MFESTTRPNIVWADLDRLNLSEGAPQLKLELTSKLALEGGIAGDVAGDFEDHGPMTFLSFGLLKQLDDAEKSQATKK